MVLYNENRNFERKYVTDVKKAPHIFGGQAYRRVEFLPCHGLRDGTLYRSSMFSIAILLWPEVTRVTEDVGGPSLREFRQLSDRLGGRRNFRPGPPAL